MSCLKTLVIPNKVTNVALLMLCLCLQVLNKLAVHFTHVLLICGCVVVVKWSCGQVVKWSSGQVVMWSCGQMAMWSSGRVVKWSSGHVVK